MTITEMRVGREPVVQAEPSGLSDFLAWCRARETLPLLDRHDLWLWSRQSPQDFQAALCHYLGQFSAARAG